MCNSSATVISYCCLNETKILLITTEKKLISCISNEVTVILPTTAFDTRIRFVK
jgi:hypothetical protein